MRISILPLILIPVLFISCGSDRTREGATRSSPTSKDALKVGLCDVVANPTAFDGKEIQISAIMLSRFEYSYLYDPKCVGDQNLIMEESAEGFESDELDVIISPNNPEYQRVGLMRASGDFSGTFVTRKGDGFGHLGFFSHKLVINKVGNIQATPSDVPYPW